MTIDVVKKEIPAAIDPNGGAYVMIVGKTTIPLATSVHEAKERLCVIGDEQFIQSQFMGLFKSMAEGVARDGIARQIGDFITIYAQPTGEVDLDKGWDSDKNAFVLKARLLNQCELDITDWAFRDVTPGRVAIKLETASTGEDDDTVNVGSVVHLNGSSLPEVAKAKVEWALSDGSKSGTVASAQLTGDSTRIDIAAAALDELKDEQYNGKTIIFTIRGNFAKASVKSTLKYVPAPETPIMTWDNGGKLYCPKMTNGSTPLTLSEGCSWESVGENFDKFPGGTIADATVDLDGKTVMFGVQVASDGKSIALSDPDCEGAWPTAGTYENVEFALNGDEAVTGTIGMIVVA